jgi:hypothetical protein
LFNQILDVPGRLCLGGTPATIKVIGEGDVAHGQVPMTRVWVTTVCSGVPVGAQMAWLSNSKSGMPLESTRTEPVTYCAVTHGPFAAGGGGRAQPATM